MWGGRGWFRLNGEECSARWHFSLVGWLQEFPKDDDKSVTAIDRTLDAQSAAIARLQLQRLRIMATSNDVGIVGGLYKLLKRYKDGVEIAAEIAVIRAVVSSHRWQVSGPQVRSNSGN